MSGYTRNGITYNSEDEANLAAAIPKVYVVRDLDAGYIAEAILDSDWLTEHDREVLTRAADEILRRRTIVGTSGSPRDDESWDNGNMSAEAIVRSLAGAVPDDAAPDGAS